MFKTVMWNLSFWFWQGKIAILFTSWSSGIFRMLRGLSVFTRFLVGKLKFGLWLNVQELHEVLPLLFVLFLDDVRGVPKFWKTPSFMLSLPSKSSTLDLPLSKASKSVTSNTSTPKSSTLDVLLRSEMSKSSTLEPLLCLSSRSSTLTTCFLLP